MFVKAPGAVVAQATWPTPGSGDVIATGGRAGIGIEREA
jgi:hypothetical protein